MKTFRVTIVCLFAILALFFNIERLDIGATDNAVNIQTFTYFLATVAVAAVLIGVPFRRTGLLFPITMWLSLYFILKLFVFYERPFWGGVHSYVVITEMSFLVLLIVLAQRVVRSLEAVEESAQEITLANGLGLQTIESATNTIRTELTRSRHYQHPLSLIVVDVKPIKTEIHKLVREILANFVQHYAVALAANEIRSQLRDTDYVFLGNRADQIVVLCPETSRSDSELIFNQVEPRVISKVGADLHVGVASFPEDGITLNGLLTCAQHNTHKPQPSSSGYQGDRSSLQSLSMISEQ